MAISKRVQRELAQATPPQGKCSGSKKRSASAMSMATTSTPATGLAPVKRRRRQSSTPPVKLSKSQRDSIMAKNKGKTWTTEEHQRFLHALERFPSGPWKAVADYIGTKNPRQTMTHAQKYRQKFERRSRGLRASAARRKTQRMRQPVVAAASLPTHNDESLQPPHAVAPMSVTVDAAVCYLAAQCSGHGSFTADVLDAMAAAEALQPEPPLHHDHVNDAQEGEEEEAQFQHPFLEGPWEPLPLTYDAAQNEGYLEGVTDNESVLDGDLAYLVQELAPVSSPRSTECPYGFESVMPMQMQMQIQMPLPSELWQPQALLDMTLLGNDLDSIAEFPLGLSQDGW